jgi:hypothetical protein
MLEKDLLVNELSFGGTEDRFVHMAVDKTVLGAIILELLACIFGVVPFWAPIVNRLEDDFWVLDIREVVLNSNS